MSKRQIYRGDPEQKILHLLEDFSGGVNVVDVDGVVNDNEFRKMVNVELSTKGLVQNRKGFKYINIFHELLADNNITLPNITHLFLVVKDEGNLIDKLIEYSYIEVQESQEDTVWTYTPTSQTLTLSDFIANTLPLEYSLTILLANEKKIYSLVITKNIGEAFVITLTELYEFIKNNGYNYNDTFEITPSTPFFKSLSLFSKYDYVKVEIDDYPGETGVLNYTFDVLGSGVAPLVSDVANDISIYVDYDDIKGFAIETQAGTHSLGIKLQGVISKKVKTNIKTIYNNNKVYFSICDIVDTENSIGVYDVENDTFAVIDNEHYYEPDPYEITNVGEDLGFNMLASNPLTAISVATTTTKSIKAIWLTNEATDEVLQKIPTNSAFRSFQVNVLTTGTTLSPNELKITLRNQGGNILNYVAGSPQLVGNIVKFIFDIDYIEDFENASSIEIEVSKNDIILEADQLTPFYPKDVIDFLDFNYGGIIYTSEENKYYKRLSGKTGLAIDSYSLLTITQRSEQENVLSADPSTIFSAYKSATYDGLFFEIYNKNDQRILYQYFNGGTSFETVYDSFSEVANSYHTFEELKDVFPSFLNIIKLGSLYYSITTQLPYYNEYEVITPMKSTYEIGVDDGKLLTGVDLKDVKIIEVNNRLLYYNENVIWFSSANKFDYLPNFNYIALSLPLQDKITSINFFRGSYIIFTKDKIYKIVGNYGESDFGGTALVSDFVGCISPNSVRAIENSLYFLSKQGLYRLVLNYYTETMENVQKIDEKIKGELEIVNNVDSLLYNGQYWLLYQNGKYDTIKQYYDIDLSNKRKPFTFDIYAQKPNIMFTNNLNLLAIRNGHLFVYDSTDYTDFYDNDEEDVLDYTPICEIETPNIMFDTPTHDKKIKAIYVKNYCDRIIPLGVTVKTDGYTVIEPIAYTISHNDIGEVTFTTTDVSNLTVKKDLLGNFELGQDRLGDGNQTVHKLVVSKKCKAIQLNFKFSTINYFGLANIGILYKLGKVKENR